MHALVNPIAVHAIHFPVYQQLPQTEIGFYFFFFFHMVEVLSEHSQDDTSPVL